MTHTAPTNAHRQKFRILGLAVTLIASLLGPLTPSTATAAVATCRSASIPTWQHVVWIVMENHNSSSIIGSSSAPYINSLAASCARASNYHGITHPSLPNYIAMTSGSTYGITDDASPAAHPLSGSSIFSQTSSRSLLESMPTNCLLTGSGRYAVKHNPQAYFTVGRTNCLTTNIPLPSTPNLSAAFTLVVPNLCNDMHDCSVATGDTWLRTYIPQLIATPQYQAGTTAIFLTWDENEGVAGNQVATIVVAPSARAGAVISTSFNHYSLLRTTEEMLRVSLLGAASSASSMRGVFHL